MYNLYGAKAPYPFLKGLIRDNRVMWFFEETGIAYNRISLDPLKGETRDEKYTALNRFQKIPTLENNGFVLTQSAAILLHLASTTGTLYPKESLEQAKHMEWCFYSMTDIETHSATIAVLLDLTEKKDHPHAQWMIARSEKILMRALNYLENELFNKKYLMGDEFYAADILLGCCLYAVRNHALVQDRPNIKALLNSYYSRPAFQRMIEVNGT